MRFILTLPIDEVVEIAKDIRGKIQRAHGFIAGDDAPDIDSALVALRKTSSRIETLVNGFKKTGKQEGDSVVAYVLPPDRETVSSLGTGEKAEVAFATVDKHSAKSDFLLLSGDEFLRVHWAGSGIGNEEIGRLYKDLPEAKIREFMDPSPQEIALESVLQTKELELAREKAERALAARDIASLQSQLAEEELRFWELRNRSRLTGREIALQHYLKTGRKDHLSKFMEKDTVPPIFKKGEQNINFAKVVAIERMEGESDEELQARINEVRKDLDPINYKGAR